MQQEANTELKREWGGGRASPHPAGWWSCDVSQLVEAASPVPWRRAANWRSFLSNPQMKRLSSGNQWTLNLCPETIPLITAWQLNTMCPPPLFLFSIPAYFHGALEHWHVQDNGLGKKRRYEQWNSDTFSSLTGSHKRMTLHQSFSSPCLTILSS